MPQSQPRVRLPLALFLIPAFAFVAVLPLILGGCSCGHDFDFHILSWFEAAAQFRAGNFHPAWAFSPAFNAGEPRFVFYPPLSWTLGALLGLAAPWAAAPIIYTWIALTAAGATMYRFARRFSSDTASLIAAAIYIANPYMLFTAYERTAYAELLAAAWIPLLLAAALRERVTILPIAIPVALLWLTNAPAAVMGCYALALIAVIRVLQIWITSRKEPSVLAFQSCLSVALRFAAGVGLGIALAAFYIVPAAYERRWVQIAMATISGMRITDNFLFHHTADPLHDQVLHTSSVIAIMLLVAALIAFTMAILRNRKKTGPLIPLMVLSVAIAFMLTPLSAFVWRIAPEMNFLQFPWRLLAVLAPTICLAMAIAIEKPLNRDSGASQKTNSSRLFTNGWLSILATLCLVAGMTVPSIHIFRQPCDDEDNVSARLALFNSKGGTDPTDEYTPTDADNDSLSHSDPAFWLTDDPDSKSPVSASPSPVPLRFTLTAPKEETLILNLREYPDWQIRLNGTLTHPATTRADGLISVPVRAGTIHVDIGYVTGRDHALGDGISLAALATTLALASIRFRGGLSPRVSS